jgi:hypothetical protein
MFINALVIILIFKGYYPYRMNNVELTLLGIGMLTKILSSFTWFLFALSNRSAAIAAIFILAAFVSMAQRGAFNTGYNNQIPKFEALSFRIVFFGLIPFLILKISELGEFISLFMVSAPFVVWFDSEINISIKDAFKALLGL